MELLCVDRYDDRQFKLYVVSKEYMWRKAKGDSEEGMRSAESKLKSTVYVRIMTRLQVERNLANAKSEEEEIEYMLQSTCTKAIR